MNTAVAKQRIYAFLMILGAGILLFRTIRMMLVENALEILVPWVNLLLIAEFIVDLSCLLSAIKWFISKNLKNAILPLRLAAIATILHAIRVLIYIMGRAGPWVNFDVKPEYHVQYTFEWFWVYFAGILSILGIVGVVVIWRLVRNHLKH